MNYEREKQMKINKVQKLIEDYSNGYITILELHTRLFECALELDPSEIINNIPDEHLERFLKYAKGMISEDYRLWVSIKMHYENKEVERKTNKKKYEKWKRWDEEKSGDATVDVAKKKKGSDSIEE